MQGTYEEMEGEVIPGHVGLCVVIFQLNLEKYRDVKGQEVRESAFQRHGQKHGGGTTQSSLWRAVYGESLFCSPWAAVTKYPALTVRLEPWPYSPGGWESEIKVSAVILCLKALGEDLAFSRSSFWWLPAILGVPGLVAAQPQFLPPSSQGGPAVCICVST